MGSVGARDAVRRFVPGEADFRGRCGGGEDPTRRALPGTLPSLQGWGGSAPRSARLERGERSGPQPFQATGMTARPEAAAA